MRRTPEAPPAADPVPFQAPARELEEVRGDVEAAIADLLESGLYVLGAAVEAFERDVAVALGVRHAVGVASGTDALRLALEGLGIGRGDEVVTSPFTFVATAEAIVHAGATPVFADIRPDTFTLDPDAVEAAVGPRTAAILPVHLFRQMAEMAALERIARRHGLAIVEDGAQAFGAWQRVSGSAAEGAARTAGACGAAGCLSFYPTKNLGGVGDGGMVVTDDAGLAERVRRLRAHGCLPGEERHGVPGYNSRLDAIQAVVLRVKLKKVHEWTERRRAHAAAYDAAVGETAGLRAPRVAEGNRHVYHQYTIRCADRPAVEARLASHGIGWGAYYRTPLHLEEALAFLGYGKGDFPRAERAAADVLSLPVHPGLRPAERARVIAALRGAGGPGEASDGAGESA